MSTDVDATRRYRVSGPHVVEKITPYVRNQSWWCRESHVFDLLDYMTASTHACIGNRTEIVVPQRERERERAVSAV